MKAARLNEETQVWEQSVPVKEWYSVQDVCTITNMGGPAVYQSIKRGSCKGHKVNGQTMVKHENLVAYIARRLSTPTFDPSQLHIEEILPSKEAAKDAEAFVEGDLDDEGLDDFLDE